MDKKVIEYITILCSRCFLILTYLIFRIDTVTPVFCFLQYFVDYKLDTPISENAAYRTEFMFYLGIVSQVSNAIISCVNTFFQFGG